MHFNLNKSLTLSDMDEDNCMVVDNISPISFELNSDCDIKHSINEKEMNFQYLKNVDCEFLHSRLQYTKIVLSLNENSKENSCRKEKKATKQETSTEGLVLKELHSHLKYAFIEPEKAKPVIISDALTENEEHKLLKILRKYKEEIAWSIEDLKGISHSIYMHKILLENIWKISKVVPPSEVSLYNP